MSPLKGQHRWITFPSTWSALIGVVLAVMYAVFTVEIHEGTRLPFGVILIIVVGLANIFGDREEQSRLKTLRGLGDGTLPIKRENLMLALGEAARSPDVTFWTNIIYWVLGAAAVGLLYGFVPTVTWATAGRIAFTGASVGPLIAMLAHLMTLRRSRTVMSRIAAQGLTAADVVRSVPAERFQLKRRMLVFTSVAVITPLALICDLGAWTGVASVDQLVAAADGAAQTKLLAASESAGLLPLLIVAGLVLFVVVTCGYLGGVSLGEPLRAIAVETERIARGQLGRSAVVPAEDELWAVSVGFASMEAQLLGALRQLKDAGIKISTTTEELIASSMKHEAGAADQTGALSQTSATTEELARSAKQIAQNASDVSRLAAQMLDAANGGKRSAGAFYASILRVREGNQAIADSVVRLNKRVQQVGRIVEFIDGIADKSDLLALNAELEGTKAGDVGRGFSLVAAEMRRLSESVMSSTREINRLIEEIRDATNAAVMATEAGVKATDAGSALARQVTESLDRIVAFANQTSDAVKAITLATHQQQAGTDQLATAMADILRSTEGALGATAQMSSANNDLSTLSKELQTTVARFEVTT
jgi:methyl-accepting chemotaxis protein